MTTRLSCRECRDYAPVDVVKGMCHSTKTMVESDADSCAAFLLMPRCKQCTQFKADSEVVEMGVCGASTSEPKFFAYPDMVSVTCEWFHQN